MPYKIIDKVSNEILEYEDPFEAYKDAETLVRLHNRNMNLKSRNSINSVAMKTEDKDIIIYEL